MQPFFNPGRGSSILPSNRSRLLASTRVKEKFLMNVSKPIYDSGTEEWFKLGKKLYYEKIGQMGLSCNQCHEQRVGQNLRSEKDSQGHVNGFPTYLLRWSKIASVHRRIQFCNEQARAIPFKIFSNEYNALQLYMTWRGIGLEIETPAVRK